MRSKSLSITLLLEIAFGALLIFGAPLAAWVMM